VKHGQHLLCHANDHSPAQVGSILVRRCSIPILVRLRGMPDDDRLNETMSAIARAVAERLRIAERIISVREGLASREIHVSPDCPMATFNARAPRHMLRCDDLKIDAELREDGERVSGCRASPDDDSYGAWRPTP